MAAISCRVYLTTNIHIPSTALHQPSVYKQTNKQINPLNSTLIYLLVISMNTSGCVVEKMQHLKVDSVLRTEQHCCTAGPELRCMCFCTAGFETYAAYALLVAKALWRDGMVYVLLLLVCIPDSSSAPRTHKPIRNWVCLFIMMLFFQLSKVTYLSTQLLVYIPTEAPVHQPTSSFFHLRFNLRTYLWTHLLIHVPTDLPTPK